MILTLTWENPTPHPSCGYKLLYRRKGASSYNTLLTSGTTSGTTSVVVHSTTPACFEGTVQSDCCSDNLSTGDPWGENAYSVVGVTASIRTSPSSYVATIVSQYANPYDTVITGTFTSNLAGVIAYSATYPAGSTSAVVTLSGTPTGSNLEVVTVTTISSITPVFNNGGSLQQFDFVNTPNYFLYTATSGQTSGTTFWNGNPCVLPSFTLDQFTVTETDTNGNPTMGDLNISWIQAVVFGGAISPYESVTFNVLEYGGTTILGTVSVDSNIKGLRNTTITMTKGSNAITTTTHYKMEMRWSDDTLVGTKDFYLPDF